MVDNVAAKCVAEDIFGESSCEVELCEKIVTEPEAAVESMTQIQMIPKYVVVAHEANELNNLHSEFSVAEAVPETIVAETRNLLEGVDAETKTAPDKLRLEAENKAEVSVAAVQHEPEASAVSKTCSNAEVVEIDIDPEVSATIMNSSLDGVRTEAEIALNLKNLSEEIVVGTSNSVAGEASQIIVTVVKNVSEVFTAEPINTETENVSEIFTIETEVPDTPQVGTAVMPQMFTVETRSSEVGSNTYNELSVESSENVSSLDEICVEVKTASEQFHANAPKTAALTDHSTQNVSVTAPAPKDFQEIQTVQYDNVNTTNNPQVAVVTVPNVPNDFLKLISNTVHRPNAFAEVEMIPRIVDVRTVNSSELSENITNLPEVDLGKHATSPKTTCSSSSTLHKDISTEHLSVPETVVQIGNSCEIAREATNTPIPALAGVALQRGGDESYINSARMDLTNIFSDTLQKLNKTSGVSVEKSTLKPPKTVSSFQDSDEDDVTITDEVCADASHLCSTCGQIFATPERLATHVNSQECAADVEILDEQNEPPKSNRKYRCDDCGRLFTFLWGFDQHIGAHLRKLPTFRNMKTAQLSSLHLGFENNAQNAVETLVRKELLLLSSKGELMCKKCGLCCDSLEEMTTHAKRHFPELNGNTQPLASALTLAERNEGTKSRRRKPPLTWIARFPAQEGSGSNSTYTAACTYCHKHIGTVKNLLNHVPQCSSLHQAKKTLLQPYNLQSKAPSQSTLPMQNLPVSSPVPRIVKPFSCECRQQFEQIWMLQQHLQTHLDKGEMTSVHAAVIMRKNQPVPTANLASSDYNSRTKLGIKCSACGDNFNSVGSLKRHKETVHCLTRLTWSECCSPNLTIGGYFQCDQCPALVSGSDEFRLHVASHAEKKLNVFLRCKLQLAKALNSQSNSSSFPTSGQPQVAVSPTLPIDSVTSQNCHYCGASFDSRTLCMFHMKRFCQKNPHIPSDLLITGSTATASSNQYSNSNVEGDSLQRLLDGASGDLHSENETFPCKYCDVVCTSLLSYSHHFEQHVKVNKVSVSQTSSNYVCLVCKRRHNSQAEYVAHMMTHEQSSANSICPGCYRAFHPAYPLVHHRQSGLKFCTKCAAAFDKGQVATTGTMRVLNKNVPILPPRVSHQQPIPSRPVNRTPVLQSMLSSPQHAASTNSAQGKLPSVMYRHSDGTYWINKNDRPGYEKVLNKLGIKINNRPILNQPASAAPVVDLCEDSNDSVPAEKALAATADDDFMPTDFLSIEMPTEDTGEQLLVEDWPSGDGEQVSVEHDYAGHKPIHSQLPFVVYGELPTPNTSINLFNTSSQTHTSYLPRLLQNSSAVRPIGTMSQQFNGQLTSQQKLLMLATKNRRSHYSTAWVLNRSMWNEETILRDHPVRPRPKRPMPTSGTSNLPIKCAKLVVSPKKEYGLRKCSVVLTRLDPKNLPTVGPSTSRQNAVPTTNKPYICGVKVKMSPPKIACMSPSPKLSSLPCRSTTVTTVANRVPKLQTPKCPIRDRSYFNSLLYSDSDDSSSCSSTNSSSSYSSSGSSAYGRQSPDCTVVLEVVNGVLVPASSKKTTFPGYNTAISGSKKLHNSLNANFDRKVDLPKKSFVIHNGKMVCIKPCVVKLQKLDVERILGNNRLTSSKSRNLHPTPKKARTAVDSQKVSSYPSPNLGSRNNYYVNHLSSHTRPKASLHSFVTATSKCVNSRKENSSRTKHRELSPLSNFTNRASASVCAYPVIDIDDSSNDSAVCSVTSCTSSEVSYASELSASCRAPELPVPLRPCSVVIPKLKINECHLTSSTFSCSNNADPRSNPLITNCKNVDLTFDCEPASKTSGSETEQDSPICSMNGDASPNSEFCVTAMVVDASKAQPDTTGHSASLLLQCEASTLSDMPNPYCELVSTFKSLPSTNEVSELENSQVLATTPTKSTLPAALTNCMVIVQKLDKEDLASETDKIV